MNVHTVDMDTLKAMLAERGTDLDELKKNMNVLMEETESFSGKSYINGGPLAKDYSPGLLASMEAHKKFAKASKKSGNAITYVPVGSVLRPEIEAQMNAATDFAHIRFPKLVTMYENMVCAKVKYNLERQYKEFFDEVSGEASHDWRLFYSKENMQYVWTERTCGIFGNLATIYRQRGTYAACDQVMVYYTYVIENYDAMIKQRRAAQLSDNDELLCHHRLVYKYHRVLANLGMNLNRATNMAPTFRFLIQYEIDEGTATGPDNEYGWMLSDVLGLPCTTKALASVSDAQMQRLVGTVLKMNAQTQVDDTQQSTKEEFEKQFPGEKFGGKVQLAQCAACQATEPYLNTYKLCSRCKSVKYCGKDCQLAHHSQHKGICKQIAAKAK